MEYHMETPFTAEKAAVLRAGDTVTLSGTLYTARDAAHKRIVEAIETGAPLPFALQDAMIYYAGPAPAKPGAVLGSCGPTTSYRMDAYTPTLLALGLRGMIGKGACNETVCKAVCAAGAVYFAATGGAGALIASCVTSAEIVCYADLGSEAVRRLTVCDFPLTVVLDTVGGNLYKSGPTEYLNSFSKKD